MTVLRRLVTASAIVIGVGLMATGCAVTPLKLGSAAIVGDQRISVATLGSQVTNLSSAVSQYPGVISLSQAQQTQATLTWLIRYQINDEIARQAGITVTAAQAEAALAAAYESAAASAEQQGVTNVTPTLILAGSGVPPDTSAELGRYEAIANQYVKMANGGKAPVSSTAQTAAEAKLASAECQAAKALDISVNPQYGQLDYSQYEVVSVPNPVARPAGPTASASPVATAPAC
jgi:hypothetical protein